MNDYKYIGILLGMSFFLPDGVLSKTREAR